MEQWTIRRRSRSAADGPWSAGGSPGRDGTPADTTQVILAVDVAVISPLRDSSGLGVLLVPRELGGRLHAALPGTRVGLGETSAQAVSRCLSVNVGLEYEILQRRAPTLLGVLDPPAKGPEGRLVRIAYLQTVPALAIPPAQTGTILTPILDSAGLPADHDQVVRWALSMLQRDYTDRPDPHGLLGEEFSLRELQQLHDEVIGEPHVKDTFRRRMTPYLRPTGAITEGTLGKPARLFRRITT